MDALGAVPLPQADAQYLAEAALDVRVKSRVRLNPSDDGHVIGGERDGVAPDLHVVGRCAEHHRVHRRPNLGPNLIRCDPIVQQYIPLAFRRAAAVAPHRRDDERPQTRRLDLFDDRPHYLLDR